MLSLPAQHHRQPVDPEPEPAGRRHPVGERLDVVRVALLAAGVGRLLREALRLLVGVVDLGERVPELHAADEELEALDDRRVVVGRPRERRELDRVVVEDRRLDQLGLDEVAERVVDEAAPGVVRARVDAALLQPLAQVVRVARPEALLLERVDRA